MSNSFKDMSTVKAYNPNLISGRSNSKAAGYKENRNGISRGSAQGRQETFLSDAVKPPVFGKDKIARKYGK